MQDTIKKLISMVEQRQEIIRRKNKEIQDLIGLVNSIYSSLSWRITLPLRKLHALATNSTFSQVNPVMKHEFQLGEPDYSFITDDRGPAVQAPAPAMPGIPEPPPITVVSETLYEALERDTMLDFFVFPIIDWEFRFQRPQQIASIIAQRGHRIFYFRTTFNSYKDTLTSHDLDVKMIADNVYQVTLATRQPVNVYRDLVHGKSSMDDLLNSIAVLKRKYAIKHSISIIDHPFWWPVARLLRNNINIYDCMDDHSGFDNNKNIETYEPSLMAEADLVVVSSEKLLSMVSGIARNIVQVKNGTDFDHFNKLPETDILKHIGGPIIGYYGAIAEWFDVGLVEACAKKYKEYQFVLIGNVTNTEIPRLKELKNVHLLGEIPYKALPQYVRYFDVCLIPFHLTKLIEATNPVKFYEYLSSGKPVVSIMLPELVPHRDLCYLAETQSDFINYIQVALNEQGMTRPRIDLARDNSWGHRGEVFFGEISKLYPSVSVIIVTYNNLACTKLCYDSVKHYSKYPNLEIIFVDNNSTDGTPAWLQQIGQQDPLVKVILNRENHGFARGNNQGLSAATGEYFVFLNNDTIVTNNWLESLMQHMLTEPSIGLICPVTNEIGNEACIRVDYTDLGSLQQFAFDYSERKTGLNRKLRMVPLFCAMIRTDLLRQIGGLNEDFKQGMFEDDDLSARIKEKGLRLCYAEDVFIHHFGRMSFKKIPTPEYQDLFKTNKAIFEKRWGRWIPHIRGWSNIPFEVPIKPE